MASSAEACVDPDRIILSQFSRSSHKSKIEILSQENDHSVTFCIWDEDHTLGNAVRHMLMKNARVDFCGYSMPHPSESKIHIRIQTQSSITALEALKKALSDLKAMTLYVRNKFEEEIRNGYYDSGEMKNHSK